MLKQITRQIHNQLIHQAKTIAVAESCTGGLLAALLTSLPGSSQYFHSGVVTYSNKSKKIMLNIPAKTITRYGAVSRQVAILMAKNIREKTHTDFGISITGMASPVNAQHFYGASPVNTKQHSEINPKRTSPCAPVGTVFICLSGNNKNTCHKFNFSGTRKNIRKNSALMALRLLSASL